MDTTVKLRIFSPRYGHEDTYTVKLTRDFMEISTGGHKARATLNKSSDPEWSAQALNRIMSNNHINSSTITITTSVLERAWKGWRDSELNDQEVDNELQLIADWVNSIIRSKPQSDFWDKYL